MNYALSILEKTEQELRNQQKELKEELQQAEDENIREKYENVKQQLISIQRGIYKIKERPLRVPSGGGEMAEKKRITKMKSEYVEKLTIAVKNAKDYNQRVWNHSGRPPRPLYEHGEVIAVFREYWLKCDEFNQKSESYYNPKWLTHEDLGGELFEVINAMPFYPIGIDEQGKYC